MLDEHIGITNQPSTEYSSLNNGTFQVSVMTHF